MVVITEIITDASHELADAANLRSSGLRTNDPMVVAIATSRAISFASSHGVDLSLVAGIIHLDQTPQHDAEDWLIVLLLKPLLLYFATEYSCCYSHSYYAPFG